MISGRERDRLARFAPPAALVLLVAISQLHAVERAGAPARLFLAIWVAGVVALLAVALPARATWTTALPVLSAPAIVLMPVEEPSTLAIVSALLTAAVAVAVANVLAATRPPRLLDWLALALAAQLALAGERLWIGAAGWAAVETAFAPVAAALALHLLARVRRELALVGALVGFAAGPGWTWAGALTLGAVATLALRWPRAAPAAMALLALPAYGHGSWWLVVALATVSVVASQRDGTVGAWARAAAALAAFVSLLAGAPPWSRLSPLESVVLGVAASPRPLAATTLAVRDLILDRDRPRWSADLAGDLAGDGSAALAPGLAGRPVRGVTVDSFLSNSTALPCATPVARLTLSAAGREVAAADIVLGAQTGEWAAGRADVSPWLACRDAPSHLRWLARDGRYFGRRYRGRMQVAAGARPDRLTVELAPGLPAEVRWTVLAIGVE